MECFGKGTRVSTTLAFEWAFATGGRRLFSILESTHNLLLGGSPGCDILGTTTIGLTQGQTLLIVMPAFSKCTLAANFNCKVYFLL